MIKKGSKVISLQSDFDYRVEGDIGVVVQVTSKNHLRHAIKVRWPSAPIDWWSLRSSLKEYKE
jgi:hypothetical protein